MDTKLAAEQPPETPEHDPPVEGATLPVGDAADVPLMAPRDAALAALADAAFYSAARAYDAHEQKVLAAGGTAAEAAEAVQALVPVVSLLAARHHDYLAQRASMFGDAPEAHLERILREFRSYHDDKRPELTAMEAQRNGGAVTRRVA